MSHHGVLCFAVVAALSRHSPSAALGAPYGTHSPAVPVVISRSYRALAAIAIYRQSLFFMAFTPAVIAVHVHAASNDLPPSPRPRDARAPRRTSLLVAVRLQVCPRGI